ncbi:MAG: hypothetical protein ACRC5T_08565, partial [Cetobacterium sp.]
PVRLTYFDDNNIKVTHISSVHRRTYFITDAGIYGAGEGAYISGGSNETTPVLLLAETNIEKFVNVGVNVLCKIKDESRWFISGYYAQFIIDGTVPITISPEFKEIDEDFVLNNKIKDVHLLTRGCFMIRTSDNKLLIYGTRRRNGAGRGYGDGETNDRGLDITNAWPFPTSDDFEIIHLNTSDWTNYYVWNKTRNKVYCFATYWNNSLGKAGGNPSSAYDTTCVEVLNMEKADSIIESPAKIIDIIGPSTTLDGAGYTFLLEDGGIIKCGGANTEMHVDPTDNGVARWITPSVELFYLKDAGFEEDRKIKSGAYSKSRSLILSDNKGDLYMAGYSY